MPYYNKYGPLHKTSKFVYEVMAEFGNRAVMFRTVNYAHVTRQLHTVLWYDY